MKKTRFSVLVLCIIFLVVLVYSGQEKGHLKEDHPKLRSPEKEQRIIESILCQVHEYQNQLLMYHKMHIANKDSRVLGLRTKAKDKLEGFIAKLKLGNNFKVDGDINILLSGNVEFWFKIKNINLEYYDIQANASGYTIDCTATIKMALYHKASPVKNTTVTMEVDHMKNCEPD